MGGGMEIKKDTANSVDQPVNISVPTYKHRQQSHHYAQLPFFDYKPLVLVNTGISYELL